MDKRRQELEELQDDTHLALLMDEYAESMGAQVRAEAEKAFENGEIAIPQELDDACASILAQSSKADNRNKSAKPLVRYCLVAAATVVVLMGMLMAAQAAGLNVFGKLASWTDSVFHFNSIDKTLPSYGETLPSDSETECFSLIKEALEECGIPTALAPRRFPDGYTKVTVKKIITRTRVIVSGELTNLRGHSVRMTIETYTDSDSFGDALWEKQASSVQTFTENRRTFYLFENEDVWTGVWSDGRYVVSFFGFETVEDLKAVIRSMKEQ